MAVLCALRCHMQLFHGKSGNVAGQRLFGERSQQSGCGVSVSSRLRDAQSLFSFLECKCMLLGSQKEKMCSLCAAAAPWKTANSTQVALRGRGPNMLGWRLMGAVHRRYAFSKAPYMHSLHASLDRDQSLSGTPLRFPSFVSDKSFPSR